MSDGVSVRLLGPGDEPVLERVADGVFDHPVDSALTQELLRDPRHHLAVAIDAGVVVAFASGVHYVHPDKRAQMFINEVGTAADYQRRGIGRATLAALVDHARTIGCTEAWMLTDHDNISAQRLYGGLGGEPVDAGLMFSFEF